MRTRGLILLLALMITAVAYAAPQQLLSSLAQVYISKHGAIARSEMIRTGVPASIKLAQGMLESDWGRSDLAVEANNHFGIKCGGQWDGPTYYKSDDDYDHRGKKIKSCFRSFDSAYESFIAHSDFLSDPKKAHRYGFLFELEPTDYKKWAKGLREAGYATDPKYPNKLIQIIEKYELYKYDSEAIELPPAETLVTEERNTGGNIKNKRTRLSGESLLRIEKINKLKVVVADGSLSIQDIALQTRRKASTLLRINEIFPDESYIPTEGTLVYIQRKKSSYRGSKKYHVVKAGETMQSIAHKYGLKTKSLYIKNRMPMHAEPLVGEKLSLYRTISGKRKPKYDRTTIPDANEELLFLDDPSIH